MRYCTPHVTPLVPQFVYRGNRNVCSSSIVGHQIILTLLLTLSGDKTTIIMSLFSNYVGVVDAALILCFRKPSLLLHFIRLILKIILDPSCSRNSNFQVFVIKYFNNMQTIMNLNVIFGLFS